MNYSKTMISCAFAALLTLTSISEARYAELNETEVELFEIIKNHEIQRRTTMQLDPRLCAIAREHCEEMKELGFFAHQHPNSGKNANDRLADIGYPLPSWYEAGQNYIESLRIDTVENASAAAEAWFGSSIHKTHVYGLQNVDGAEFYRDQILIGVAYVEKTAGQDGYYAFISAHPPVGQEWKIDAGHPGPGLLVENGALTLTSIPTHGVFTIEEAKDDSFSEWKTIGAGFVESSSVVLGSLQHGVRRFYRIRWTAN